MRACFEAAALTEGPVSRKVTGHGKVGSTPLTGNTIARIVKRSAEPAGIDAANLSGHSMREGVLHGPREGRAHRS